MAGASNPKPAPAKPVIYEAWPGNSATGAIQCGNVITSVAAAAARRQMGLDIVVCGGTRAANCGLAEQIEKTVGPAVHHNPHYHAGHYALPHWQPNPRPPAGHSYYETAGVKATPPKPAKPRKAKP
jgi:hypothetical protein